MPKNTTKAKLNPTNQPLTKSYIFPHQSDRCHIRLLAVYKVVYNRETQCNTIDEHIPVEIDRRNDFALREEWHDEDEDEVYYLWISTSLFTSTREWQRRREVDINRLRQ